MKPTNRIAVSSVISPLALCLLLCTEPARAQERAIGLNSASDALRLLNQARLIDKMNSQSWTASNPTLDRYFAHKVTEIDRLIDRLRRGQAVSLEAIDNALDTQDAKRLGGGAYPSTARSRQSL